MSRKKSTAAAASSVEPAAPVPAPLSAPPPVGRFEVVEVSRIILSRTNPRKYFDPARIAELRLTAGPRRPYQLIELANLEYELRRIG